MKNVQTLITALAMILTVSSCNKSLTNRLIGTWITTSEDVTVEQSMNGTNQKTNTKSNGTKFIFKDGGSGIMSGTDSNGAYSENFTWTATDAEVSITTSTDKGTIVFKVIKNEKKVQQWTFDYSININMVGIIVSQKFSGTYDLSKQ